MYINVLKNAWESDNEIDRSEAQLLEALRYELGIWTREHLLLEHHPDVRKLWDNPNAYVSARNHLLITGIVLTYENNYVIADEVAIQIKRSWGIDLEKDSYYDFQGRPGRSSHHPSNYTYFFRPGLTWPRRTQKGFNVRAMRGAGI